MSDDRWIRRNRDLEARHDFIRAIVAGQTVVDLGRLLEAQRAWSARTFGARGRVTGVIAHIRKELFELEAAPGDLEEWADVIILAMDGAWRATGCSGEDLARAVVGKMARNRERSWPSPETVADDQPIEHVRGPGAC